MDLKKISIIVPIYKVEKYLQRCVESIIHQTYKNIEIILVDDGSPDSCPQICEQYAKKDKRIRVIHKKNGGLSDARNEGLRAASGDYVMYVDSDDYIETDACEKLIMNMSDDVDVVVGVCKEINGSNYMFQKHTNLEPGKIYDAKDYVRLSIEKNEWYAPAWLNLYRRKFLLENNLYYKVGYIFEDIEMLPRLFLANPKVVYMDYAFYNYVIRENSIMTSKMTNAKIKMSIDIFSNWYKLITDVEDKEHKRILYGVLVKYYLSNARMREIKGWKSEGLSFLFAWNYALNIKERAKIIMFSVAPKMYFAIGRYMKGENK